MYHTTLETRADLPNHIPTGIRSVMLLHTLITTTLLSAAGLTSDRIAVEPQW